jgi:FAD:protein FMN transferase
MTKKSLVSLIITVLIILVSSVLFFVINNKKEAHSAKKVEYIHNQGKTQGTTYSITYQQPDKIDLQTKIEARLHQFDLSLSSYDSTSIISRINRNDTTVRTDKDFEDMFNLAQEAAKKTDGAFDITVGPLVKAWGFAFGNNDHSKLPNPKDFLPFVGYQKVRIQNHKVIKDDPRIIIDANGIAQGQSSDIIGKLLEDNGCKNFMVEIGGEIVCKGMNPEGKKWRIGIDKPVDDSLSVNNELQTIIELNDGAVTTAGNYRKFHIINGKKYGHLINPHTGYPETTNLLSVTVLSSNGIVSDTYDTPFMVLGLEKSLEVCKKTPGLECYFIYVDKNGKNQEYYTKGFKKYLTK